MLLRKIAPIIFCFCLNACGFHPLYTSDETTCGMNYPLKIATIPNREGQILRNYLVDLLTHKNLSVKPKYTLEVKLTETPLDLGILKDETVNRKQITVTADIVLRNSKSKIIYEHTAIAINSFAVLSQDYYADFVTEEYSKKEALHLLAEKIKLLVSLYLDNDGED